MRRRRDPFATLASLLFLLAVASSCGGGGGSGPSDGGGIDFDFGLVSGAKPTNHAVTLVNPLAVAAQVRAVGNPAAFRLDPTTLPVGTVPAGGSFDCDVTVVPSGPGEVQGDLSVEFFSPASSNVAVYVARAMVEDVRMTSSPSLLDFGPVAFGASAERTTLVRNASAVSVVEIDRASFPSPDFSVSDPPLPFSLVPGQSRIVRIRCAPFESMAAGDDTVTLRSSGADGDVPVGVRVTPTAGTAVVDFGTRSFVGGTTEELAVDVPAHVWAVQVEAWRPGHEMPDYVGSPPDPTLPAWDVEEISLALFEAPNGDDHHFGWHSLNGAFAACLPRSHRPQDQIAPGGGTYRFRFVMNDAPAGSVPVRVRAVLKATPTGDPALGGTLDLNLWIDGATGTTAATAPGDPVLQNALAQVDQLLRTEGVQIGDIDYYDSNESATGGGPVTETTRLAAIRAVLPKTPGVVQDRLNLFVGNHSTGSGGRTPGCAIAYSNHSVVRAGYQGNLFYLIAHECLHHLGLWHIGERPMDVGAGGFPANIMDVSIGQAGNTISPGQGRVIRAHPFVR